MKNIYLIIFVLFYGIAEINAQGHGIVDYTSYTFPTELTAASKASKIAVAINEQGKRNIYVAEDPDFKLRKLTSFTEDNGDEITSVRISDDGKNVVFVKGGDHGAFDESMPRNPASIPKEPKVQIWSIPFEGGTPVFLTDGDYPIISPDNKTVVFEKNGQIWNVSIDGHSKPGILFYANGKNTDPQWSPDGSRLAFVSDRGDHSLIGIYKSERESIQWLNPSFDKDVSPRWSPDGKQIAFIRTCTISGATDSITLRHHRPWSIRVANVITGGNKLLWQSPESLFGSVPLTQGGFNLHWTANNRVIFLSDIDGWPHLYSISSLGGKPICLTPGNFMIEHVNVSSDLKKVVFSTNTGQEKDDIDRRHIAIVSTDKADMNLLTNGTGIETFPVFINSANNALAIISATAQQPGLPAILSLNKRDIGIKLIGSDLLPASFMKLKQVVPKHVEFKAQDGKTVYGQLFVPPNIKDKNPAILFIHGGPFRQMLLGWNYGDYYSNTYAINQYLVSKGFIVLSVNYRLGIGYGDYFQRPDSAGRLGASEYKDIKAAGEWLAAKPEVDPGRIGVYGGSYGGFLTAMALGKNSDIFAAGVDISGVHNFLTELHINNIEPAPDQELALKLARESSPVSYVNTWKSPVLFIHGDDDGNVEFHQTVDLLTRLRKKNVHTETLMIPDETHHWMKYSHQVMMDSAVVHFLEKELLKK